MADERPTTGEGGVLGNLPHSRPGRRSQKRDAGKPSRARRQAPAAAPKSPRPVREEPFAGAPDSGTGGPIGDAVHAATKVAGTGVRVAGALAHEVLRRLPRL